MMITRHHQTKEYDIHELIYHFIGTNQTVLGGEEEEEEEGIARPKTDYNLKIVKYPAYGIHHRLQFQWNPESF